MTIDTASSRHFAVVAPQWTRQPTNLGIATRVTPHVKCVLRRESNMFPPDGTSKFG